MMYSAKNKDIVLIDLNTRRIRRITIPIFNDSEVKVVQSADKVLSDEYEDLKDFIVKLEEQIKVNVDFKINNIGKIIYKRFCD